MNADFLLPKSRDSSPAEKARILEELRRNFHRHYGDPDVLLSKGNTEKK